MSYHFLLLCLLLSALTVSTLIDAAIADEDDNLRLANRRALVKLLSLTDPALFTEAR